ncbi:MAG: RNA polymerase sigma factor RpoH, partial [Gammaproteobacteria bacterium]|nr:RNA polymerase sigma factor RpoH [Gammaproteobacteria bacterium]
MNQAMALHRDTLPAPVAGDLSGYLQRVASFELLSADEERRLAYRLRDQQDLEAARTLVLSNLRFVVHIARGYNGYGLPLA